MQLNVIRLATIGSNDSNKMWIPVCMELKEETNQDGDERDIQSYNAIMMEL